MKDIPVKFVFCCLFLIAFSSCGDDEDCCVNIDIAVNVHYKTTSGENLIDSAPDFSQDSIRIFYKNGNEYEYPYQSNLDHPNMHYITEIEEERLLTVFASTYFEGYFSTTLIALNSYTVDTLLCEFELNGPNQVITQSWLNGTPMPNRFLEVKK